MVLKARARSNSISLAAPIGGWNARDAIASMAPVDAVVLTNWFPTTTECQLRLGHTQYSTGLPDQVDTILTYYGGATSKMFAISVGGVYDVTSGGSVGAAELSGLSNSRWESCNVSTSGGNFLYMANGVDTPYIYNGTTWTSITGVSTPAITGVTTTSLQSPMIFKERVWFIQKNTLKAWYLPVNAVGGAAASVDMSAVANLGGYIVAHGTWTIDAGSGMDDYYVAVTSRGEIIVYQGTDPSDATKWALKGVWNLGSPVGSRCLYKFAGDLLYISQDGLIPLGAALQSSRVNPRVALTDKIQYATSTAISSYGGNFGWDIVYFAKENMLLLNVPVAEGANQQQYVMNTISKSWCNFTGWNANCWALYNDDIYFGGNGFVGKAWNGYDDNGANITGTALQSFQTYGNSGNLKRFSMIRPIFRTNGSPSILGNMNLDFNTEFSNAPLSFTPATGSIWDSAVWDTAVWGGDLRILQNWQGVQGLGYYAAPQIKLSSSGIDTRWVSTDIVFEVGAVL